MKKILVLFAALLFCSVATAGTTKKNQTITDQGLSRTYHLYIPDNLPSGAPLVFILHGYGGSAESYLNNTTLTFKQLAEEYKVMLCYPQATTDPKPKKKKEKKQFDDDRPERKNRDKFGDRSYKAEGKRESRKESRRDSKKDSKKDSRKDRKDSGRRGRNRSR